MGHWLRLTNAPFRNFEKILNLRNESASFALMNSEKPTALAAGFRAGAPMLGALAIKADGYN